MCLWQAIGTKIQRQNSKHVLYPSFSICPLRYSDPQYHDGTLISGEDPIFKYNISELLYGINFTNTNYTLNEVFHGQIVNSHFAIYLDKTIEGVRHNAFNVSSKILTILVYYNVKLFQMIRCITIDSQIEVLPSYFYKVVAYEIRHVHLECGINIHCSYKWPVFGSQPPQRMAI